MCRVKKKAQTDTCVQMLYAMYLWIPAVITIIITFVMSKMNVEKENAELRQQMVKSISKFFTISSFDYYLFIFGK